ncbi:RNA polymerase sigma factor [Halodesulfovibrio sp.]|uniref:RNA polymerase sigma factor n=1 Tax=Halodesulfovibrio sp. TaxID=1912772 RepID=UPI0025BEAD17|nr:RNA polymerase sigma factor [Halodesulfovibrio sp.]
MRSSNHQSNDAVSDNEVVVSVLKGDTEAYALLITKYQSKIYSIFVRSIRSQAVAAELAQDVFLKAYENLGQYVHDKKFSTWLNAIAINTLRDYWRREGKKNFFTDELDIEQVFYDSSVEACVLGRSIMQIVHELPDLYREALLLRYRDDLPVKEVADSLGIGVSAAKMRLKRGIQIISNAVGVRNEERYKN